MIVNHVMHPAGGKAHEPSLLPQAVACVTVLIQRFVMSCGNMLGVPHTDNI